MSWSWWYEDPRRVAIQNYIRIRHFVWNAKCWTATSLISVIFIKFFLRYHLFKKSNQKVNVSINLCSLLLQGVFNNGEFKSSRHPQSVFKTFKRLLQDVLKMSSKRLQDVLQRHLFSWIYFFDKIKNFIKNESLAQVFVFVKFSKFAGTPFLQNTTGQLLLIITASIKEKEELTNKTVNCDTKTKAYIPIV